MKIYGLRRLKAFWNIFFALGCPGSAARAREMFDLSAFFFSRASDQQVGPAIFPPGWVRAPSGEKSYMKLKSNYILFIALLDTPPDPSPHHRTHRHSCAVLPTPLHFIAFFGFPIDSYPLHRTPRRYSPLLQTDPHSPFWALLGIVSGPLELLLSFFGSVLDPLGGVFNARWRLRGLACDRELGLRRFP